MGRLAHVKGIVELVQYLTQVPKRDQLTVIGDGPQFPELVEALRVSLTDVTLLGAQDHATVLAHMRESDCVVVPSREENYRLVVSEALREGVPVVAADFPPFRDRILDGLNGMLVPGGPQHARRN